MRQSRRLKNYSLKQRSSQRAIERVKEKAGRSEMLCSKPQGNGSCSLMQTETYTQGCSRDLLPLRMTLISLLAQNGSAKLTIGGRSLHFSPGFILEFFSELAAIRRRELRFSEDHRYPYGIQMASSLMSRFLRKRKKTEQRLLKYRLSAKLKNK